MCQEKIDRIKQIEEEIEYWQDRIPDEDSFMVLPNKEINRIRERIYRLDRELAKLKGND